MNGLLRIISLFSICASLGAIPARAFSGAEALQARYQAALNRMVQDVGVMQDPAAKRARLEVFVAHIHQGLENALAGSGPMPGALTDADRAALTALAGQYADYAAELQGNRGFERVPDSRLDSFAGYLRQGTEQAAYGGGIYLSGGAIILILILIILLT